MKLTLYFFIFFYCLNLKAQESSSGLEKNIFNIEIGAVGFWLNNELKLSDEIALRTEIGLCTEIVKGIGFFMAPEITFEPRWYYNIKKRVFKKLDTRNNSANFLTIRTNFRSSIFEISNYDQNRAENSIAFIPKWGIRRNITKSFNYELGAGIGFLSVINQKYSTLSDSDGIVVDAHIRLSYTF